MKFFFEAYDNDLCERVWKSCEGYDFRNVLKQLSCPYDVFYGEKDFIYKPEIEDYLLGAREAVMLSNTGHHPYIECPIEFFKNLTMIK